MRLLRVHKRAVVLPIAAAVAVCWPRDGLSGEAAAMLLPAAPAAINLTCLETSWNCGGPPPCTRCTLHSDEWTARCGSASNGHAEPRNTMLSDCNSDAQCRRVLDSCSRLDYADCNAMLRTTAFANLTRATRTMLECASECDSQVPDGPYRPAVCDRPIPHPASGEVPCEISRLGFRCGDNVDLSGYAGLEAPSGARWGPVFTTPPDSDGYIYKFKLLESFREFELPAGCRAAIPRHGGASVAQLTAPAVVQVNATDPDGQHCVVLGAFNNGCNCKDDRGPGTDCSQSGRRTCGMTYEPLPYGGLAVTWRYQYGALNTFRVELTKGREPQPHEAPQQDPENRFDPYLAFRLLRWPSLDIYGSSGGAAVVWSFASAGQVALSASTSADGTVYFGAGQSLYAVTAAGEMKWSLPVSVCSTPTLGADGTIYVTSFTKLLAMAANGRHKWNVTIPGHMFNNPPAVGADGTIYIGTNYSTLHAFEPDGKHKWNFTASTGLVGVTGLAAVRKRPFCFQFSL